MKTLTDEEKVQMLLEHGYECKVIRSDSYGLAWKWIMPNGDFHICPTGVVPQTPNAQAIYARAMKPKRTWAKEPWSVDSRESFLDANGGPVFSVVGSEHSRRRAAFAINSIAGFTAESPEAFQRFIKAALAYVVAYKGFRMPISGERIDELVAAAAHIQPVEG